MLRRPVYIDRDLHLGRIEITLRISNKAGRDRAAAEGFRRMMATFEAVRPALDRAVAAAARGEDKGGHDAS